jgi:acyl carrier protein
MDTKAQIRSYIAGDLLFSTDGFHYSDDSSFMHEGIIDSVGVLNLVLFVEETFGIHVDDREVTPDNFDSVNRLSDYIHRKIATPA